jgi:hypothetical protein
MPPIDSLTRHGTSVCQNRGYCGPFVNSERYDATPGWEGIADCEVCGNTVQIARHRVLGERDTYIREPDSR